MEHKSPKDEDGEVDLESGLVVTEDDSKNVCSQQGKIIFTKISYAEDGYSGCCNESRLTVVSMDMVKVTNKLYSVECAENNTPEKEKRKKCSNKKASKPPRPPRAPSLDAADQKLIREITELAMLKRARIERMKALKKMKAAKASSSSSSSMFAMLFTVVFCIVILLQAQGMSSGTSSVETFHGSPVPAGVTESGLIDVQHQLNPFSSDTNTAGLESDKIVQQVTSSDLPAKLRRDAVVLLLVTSSATACCIHSLKFRVGGDFAFEASRPCVIDHLIIILYVTVLFSHLPVVM
ncbi:hypothetical protein VNO78_22826 [Psophocarpus tetragonolobus]|uniref:Transmembrane protein n=1 Tax=Psophocarpus tetragonolobus TaxID=3891 RepID=A0AAN9S3G6_PSOTE